METTRNPTTLEAQLHAQLGEIGREIAKLVAEREALQRVLTRVSGQPGQDHRGLRRNSHGRLLVEKRILETIRAAEGKPLSTQELLKEARTADPKLKEATFRSHLHRLKKRALVAPHADRRGHWQYAGEC